MKRQHPAEGVLRAYLDGELSPFAALRCAWHVRRCGSCRARLEEERRVAQRAAHLVSRLALRVDIDDRWERVKVLSGIPARRRLPAWPALGIAAVALLTTIVVVAPDGWRAGAGIGRATLRAQDVCCWDLDGGGPGDDGVFTLSRVGEVVACVILYDDIDGSGDLTAPDVIRYVSDPRVCGRRPASGMAPPAAGPVLASIARAAVQ
jgi:hypothetical protein